MGSFSGSLPKSTSGSPTSVPDTPLRFGSGAPNLGCPKLRSPNPSPPLEGPPGTGPGIEVPGKGPKGRPAYSGLGVQKGGFGHPSFWASWGPPWGLVWGPFPNLGFRTLPGRVRKPHFSRFGRSLGPWPGTPSKPAQTVQKLTFCGFPGDPRKTQKTGFYDSNFLIRPIACFSGGVPPKSHFFPKKSLFRGSPPNRGLGPVWDRFGTGLGPVWHPSPPPLPRGGKGGKSEVWKGPKN